MQICPACGRENPDGFLHCGFCTASLSAPAAPRRKLATLVFCDMTGSTAMGERVDAETVQSLMLSYFHEMRGALERHGGTVEKFVGDAVLAVFGVPEAHEDDALRACRAALEMQARLVSLNEELQRRYDTRIALRIGVSTGEVVARDASSRETFVTGDAVNVAARLEQAAAPGEVLLGEPTFRLVRESVTVEPVEPLSAKGKSEPLVAYRLVEVAGLGPLPRRPGAPLVGREQELALLEQEFDLAVAERRCRLVTVVGEPGVGKSRLATELVDRIGPRARAVRGGCLSYGEGITYWAVGQIVRELAGILDEHSPEQARARVGAICAGVADGPAVVAQIAQLFGIGEGVTTAEEIAWAIRQFLAAAATEQPLLVLVDDIHWAEPAMLELLARVPARIEEASILVVCLARPELLEGCADWAVTVRLEPLREAELDLLLGSLGAPPAVRAQLAQAAAGNPLFAEELIGMLVDEGVLRQDDSGVWVLERALEEVALPVSLSALLGARLDRLDAQARDVLERGAIEGELFHRGAVVDLSAPESRSAVPGRLEGLADRDLVRPAAASFAGEAAFRFKHILVREAAYRATAKKLRAVLHERFANWLERFARERLSEYEEILGYHLEQSYRYRTELGPLDDDTRALGERAAGHLAAAGRRAERREGIREADRYYGRALELVGDDRSQLSFDLWLHRAGTLNRLGDLRRADEFFVQVADGAAGIGRPNLRARALIGRANIAGKQGLAAEARSHVAEAKSIAAELADHSLQVRATYEAADVHSWFDGDLEAAVDEMRRGLDLAEELDNHGFRVEGHMRLAVLLYNLGDLAGAEEQLRRCEPLLAELGSLRDEARVTFQLGLVKYHQGQIEEAERLGLRALDWLERTGETYFKVQNLRTLALCAAAQSNVELAEERLRQAIPLALELGGWLVVEIYRCLVDVLIRQDRLGDARVLGELAARNLPEEDAYARAACLLIEANLATADGRRADACDGFGEALRLLEQQRLPLDHCEARLAYGRALRHLGDEAGAAGELEQARVELARMGARGLVGEIEHELAELRERAGQAGPLTLS